MKLNKLGKFAALCMAGCMLLGGCGAENPADEKTVTGNAADVSAEKSETRMDSENNTTEKNDMAAEDTAAETESAETETEDSGVAIPEVVIEPKEIPDTDGMKFVRDMKIGWNLGNTFDAITDSLRFSRSSGNIVNNPKPKASVDIINIKGHNLATRLTINLQ